MDCSTPWEDFPILHYLPEFAQIHVHLVGDAIQPSYPPSPLSPPALSISQHQGLFQYFGHLIQRADSLEKTLMLGKFEGRRRRGRGVEMVGWHHQLNKHAFQQTLRDNDGPRNLACCSLRGCKELDTV